MNLNPVLAKLEDVTGLPVEQDIYSGEEERYITFVYQLERPADYADNEPISDTCDVYVNLYVPIGYEYFELKDTIREYLEKTGFHVEISSFLETGKRSTERIRRIIYDCSITKMR